MPTFNKAKNAKNDNISPPQEPTGPDFVDEMARYDKYFLKPRLTDDELRDLIHVSRKERAMFIAKGDK